MLKLLGSRLFLALLFFIIGGLASYYYFQDSGGTLEDEFSKIIQNDSVDDIKSKFDDAIDNFKNKTFKNESFDEFFDDKFFDSFDEPMKEMEKFRKSMEKKFKRADKDFTKKFNGWFESKFGGGKLSDIKTREDKDSISYIVNLGGDISDGVKVRVENSWVKISGIVKKKETKKEGGFRSTREYHSSFNRVLPVPKGGDPDSAKVDISDGKVIIRFKKK